jgi:hypothetical protein
VYVVLESEHDHGDNCHDDDDDDDDDDDGI